MPEIANKVLLQEITLAVDAGSYSLENIELAVKMATAFNAQVHGLFVEDVDLLQVAELPFSVEITLSTAQERSLNAQSMQRALHAQSLQFRDYLAQTAERSQVLWSFKTVRGRKIEAGLSGIEGAGLMIVGQALPHRQSSTGLSRKKRILLFDDQATDLLNVLEVVMDLAATQMVELTVVEPEGGDMSQLLLALEEKLKDASNLILTQLASRDFERIIKKSVATPDYVIASMDKLSENLRLVMEDSLCPVILVA